MQTSILPQHDPDVTNSDVFELALQKAEVEIGPASTQAFRTYWLLVGLSNVVAGVVVGAVFAQLEGAVAGGGVALLGSLFSCAVFIHAGAVFGSSMSRTTAICAGAVAGIFSINLVQPFEVWELNAAVLAGAGSSALAAFSCREYLARVYGCHRWKFTSAGLLVRTMFVALTIVFWTACQNN